jgi:hypothetical protein
VLLTKAMELLPYHFRMKVDKKQFEAVVVTYEGHADKAIRREDRAA